MGALCALLLGYPLRLVFVAGCYVVLAMVVCSQCYLALASGLWSGSGVC